MSMAVSRSRRGCRLLDHKLIDFVTRIPASMKMAGLETKTLFKRAVADLVPEEILSAAQAGIRRAHPAMDQRAAYVNRIRDT